LPPASGAHVIATTSRRNDDFEHALGDPTVLDYTSEDVVKAIKRCSRLTLLTNSLCVRSEAQGSA
jgi:hypothetical protein